MADTGLDGAIYVGVLPDLTGFDEKLRGQARKSGLKFGDDFASAFDAALGPQMRDDVRKAVTAATQTAPKVQVGTQLETAEAKAKLQQFATQKTEVQAKVDADTKQAQIQIDRLTRQQAQLQVKVDADDAEAKAKVAQLEAKKIQIQAKVDADTAAAIAKLAELDRRIADLNNRSKVKVDADTSGAESGLAGLLGKLDRGIGSAGGLAGALAAIGPAALPSLAAVTAGVGAMGAAIGGAAVVGIGTGLLAFHGLDDAVKALNDQQSKAAGTAAQAANATQQLAAQHLAAAGAADQLKQAHLGLAEAEANAADAARTATERVQTAEDQLAGSQRQAKVAQDDLTQARKDAAQQLQDMSDRLKDAYLSQEEATLAIARAQEHLNQVRADPKASDLDRQEAQLALERARQTAEEQTKQYQRTAAEKAAADKAGVEGSKTVQAAQQKVVDANKTVADSHKAVADALYQQDQTARRNAYSVAQAQQAIVSAQRSVESSAISMAKVAVPAIDKVADAFRGKSQAFKDFAYFIAGLGPGFDRLAAAGQKELFPKLTAAIQDLSPLLPTVTRGIAAVASAMGDAAVTFAKALLSPESKRFLTDLLRDSPGIIRELGRLTASTARALSTIFDASLPAGKTLLRDVVTSLDDFFKRINSPQGRRVLADFFSRGIEALKGLGDITGGLFDLLGALIGAGSKGGANTAAGVFRAIGDSLHWLASVIRDHKESGKILGAIALGFAALKVVGIVAGPLKAIVGAFASLGRVLGIGAAADAAGEAAGAAAGAGGMAGVLEGIGAALASLGPVGWAIAAVLAALAAAFFIAWSRSQTFRDVVGKSLRVVGDVFTWLWHDVVHPILEFWKVSFEVLWAVATVIFDLFAIGLKLLGRAFGAMYTDHIKPWWERDVQPLLEKFGNFLDEHVIRKFRAAARVIGGIFGDIVSWWSSHFSDAIKLINKLIGAFNDVATTFHVPTVRLIDNPFVQQSAAPTSSQITSSGLSSFGHAGGHATGGVILGPGTGTSDSIPAWLSSGEYVLRAAAVKALGVPFLHSLNRADGYQGPIGGHDRYAGGGVVGSVVGAAEDLASVVADPAAFLVREAKRIFSSLGDFGILSDLLKALPGPLISGMAKLLTGVFGGGGAGVSSSPITASGSVLAIGQHLAAARGWTGGEWQALEQLWQHESGWNPLAKNPSSTAFGIPQFLSSTARAYGLSEGDTNPAHQIAAGLQYIAASYGDPINAWAKWQSRSPHWYRDGGLIPEPVLGIGTRSGQSYGFGEQGPEMVLNAKQYASMTKAAVRSEKPTININYPPWMPPEQALVDAQARADLLNF